MAVVVALLIGAGALALLFWNRSSVPVSEDTAAIVLQSSSQAVPPIQSVVQTRPTPGTTAPVPSGMVAAPVGEKAEDLHQHDQETPKPSPEVVSAIREMKKPSSDEGRVINHADGTREVSLGNRFMSVPVATVGKDGKVHVDYHGEKYATEPKTETQQPESKNKETQAP
jgi:hypothetical protein